jgi:hypothetical protein
MTAKYILTYSGGYSIASAVDVAADQHHMAYGFSPREAIDNLRRQPEFQSWLRTAGLRAPLDSEFIMQAPDNHGRCRGHNHAGRPALRLVVSNGRTIES